MSIVSAIINLKVKRIAILGIHFVEDSHYELNLVECSLRNRRFVIEKNVNSLDSLSSLKDILSPSVPLCINLTGHEVINRTRSYESNYLNSLSQENILNNILPGSNLSDLSWQLYKFNESGVYVSITRYTTVETIINDIKALGFFVVDYFLGPFTVFPIYYSLSEQPLVLNLKGYRLQFETQLPTFFEDSTNLCQGEVVWQNLQIEKQNLILVGAAYIVLTKDYDSLAKKDIDIVFKYKEEYRYYRNFHLVKNYALILIFIVLLINTLIYFDVKAKNDAMIIDSDRNSATLINLYNVQTQVKNRERIIREFGLAQNGRFAFFSDCIASSMPDSKIRLTQLNIFPVNEKKSLAQFMIEPNLVKISGEVYNSATLQNFLKKLKQYSWVEYISISSYNFLDDKQYAEFTIEITISKV